MLGFRAWGLSFGDLMFREPEALFKVQRVETCARPKIFIK